MKRTTFSVISCIFLLASLHAWAVGAKVGWIDSIQPAGATADAVNIQRDGKALPYTPANRLLYEGDQITLAKDGLTLKLVIGESTILVKSSQAKPGTPYVVKLAGEIPSVQKNLLDWMSDKIKGKDGQRTPAKTISASSRSIHPVQRPLSMPVIGANNAQLVGGQRDLRLVWQGGTAPYKLVLNQGGKEIVAENIAEPAHVFSGIALLDDKLELKVEDSKGKRFVETVRIVPESRRPAMPAPLREAKLDADIRNRLYGEWLIEQGNDWSLEALQWLGQ